MGGKASITAIGAVVAVAGVVIEKVKIGSFFKHHSNEHEKDIAKQKGKESRDIESRSSEGKEAVYKTLIQVDKDLKMENENSQNKNEELDLTIQNVLKEIKELKSKYENNPKETEDFKEMKDFKKETNEKLEEYKQKIKEDYDNKFEEYEQKIKEDYDNKFEEQEQKIKEDYEQKIKEQEQKIKEDYDNKFEEQKKLMSDILKKPNVQTEERDLLNEEPEVIS